MAELKTKPTDADVAAFLAAVEPAARRQDAEVIATMLSEVTGEEPKLWGPSIVGYGEYHYRYATGREGDWFLAGFAPRKAQLVLHLQGGFEQHAEALAALGKHSTGAGCLYIKKLADVDLRTLRAIVEKSVAWARAQ